MLSYEKYETNIKIHDKYDIKDIKINKAVTYKGNLDLLIGTKLDEDNQSPPLAAAVVGINNTSAPLPSNLDFHNAWTDIDAQEAYLNTKPTCYLIVGKPGLGSYTLGENLSKKLNCIHLSSRNVILDEIEQKSSTGNCLDFNLRHNKVCKFGLIFAMMQAKIRSPVLKHRGYVISGLPLVTSSTKEEYFLNTLHAEESLEIVEDLLHDLLLNLRRKKPKPKVRTVTSHSSLSSDVEKGGEEEEDTEEEQKPEDEAEEEEVEPVVEMPKYLIDTCNDIIHYHNISLTSKRSDLLKQIRELFSITFDIIIHIISPDVDTVTKRSRKFFNYVNSINSFQPFIPNPDLQVRWPNKYTMMEYSKPYETYVFNSKYNCKQPIYFRYNSVNQICNYKNSIGKFLEKRLNDFDTQYILKIDGRISVHQMLYFVMGKLLLSPVKPVLIPKPLYLEEPSEELDEFWSTMKVFNVIKSGALNINRYASHWYNRCPVELQRRRSIPGKSKLAVTLFNRIFLLSSLDSMIAFCKNPRPYLKVEYLEPTCRVIIMGTKSTGKTMVAKCLSWLFDTDIICYSNFLENEKQKKYLSYTKTILSEIIATIEDARFLNWQNAEVERTSDLNKWFTSVFSSLKSYISLLEKTSKHKLEEELTEEGQTGKFPHLSDVEAKKIKKLKNQLSFLPILDDLQLCKEAIVDNNLLIYAPIELATETSKPTLPILGDEDVTEAISAYIVANDLQKDIEPSTEELMIEMVNMLSTIDKESLNHNEKYGKFIIDDFPSDPEFWVYLDKFKLLPDYTIALIENKEIDVELLNTYLVIDKSPKDYQERYLLSNDPLVKLKQQYKKPSSDSMLDIQIIIEELLNSTFNLIVEEEYNAAQTPEAKLASFSEAIEKFREEYESVKVKLEENSKAIISVEIDIKNDIEVLDEVLIKLRQSYYLNCIPSENAEIEDNEDNSEVQDLLTYNDSYYLGETNIYCPIAYYDYGVLWEGKTEFCNEIDNKSYFFCKEECLEVFQYDVTKYQTLNKPVKSLPPLRICVLGSIGSGKTTLCKQIAKELGLMHIDFEEFVNNSLIPRHFNKVGRPYENVFKDISLDDETAMEFQFDEENDKNVLDILFKEKEIRRMVYNYFEKGEAMLPPLIKKVISLLWFSEPFSRIGFVLDGFPKLGNDIEEMVACYCIPDLMIDLQGSAEKTLERLSSPMFKKWKMQLRDAKYEVKMKFEKERNEWVALITQKVVIKLIIDEIINKIFEGTSTVDVQPERPSLQSTIIDAHPSGSSNVDSKNKKPKKHNIEKNPEPIDESQWEKPDDALERINNRLESIYEIDDENLQIILDTLVEYKIKNVSINGNKSAAKVFKTVLPTLSHLKKRTKSFFEQTFIISCDIAETLLSEGLYLLSKFNRMCPVFISENPHVISNLYNAYKSMDKNFPIIHRSYIYFLGSVNSVKKFRKDPLKYILSDAINSYREYPLRIGIIGPPKSGKSELASKLAKRYGLMCISRGQAIRHVLENMEWSEMSKKMRAELQLGECIKSEHIMNAVHTLTIDSRAVTNGFVFDGFPDTPAEATELYKLGLYPIIIINIESDSNTIINNSQSEVYYHLLKHKPPYSRPFMEYRNFKWKENSSRIREWIKADVQNMYTVRGDSSKWHCLHEAEHYIKDIISKVQYYLLYVKTNIVPAGVMCFSNKIFEERMSVFKNLCPICLRKNILRHSDFPVDKKGLVQLGTKLYWFCAAHMDLGLAQPNLYLKEDIKIPEIPVHVKTISPALLYENGICIVTYADNLPSQKIFRGDRKFAASYRGKYYLFCNFQCLQKFLSKPHMYHDITVFKETAIFPKLTLKNLPSLGYLEQTLGNILTKACCSVNVMRPKYPGLSIQLSGLLYIALHLKVNNPVIADPILQVYEKVYRSYERRCKLIHDVGFRLRSTDNPFAMYPKSCSPRMIDSFVKIGSLVSETSSNASEYYKINM